MGLSEFLKNYQEKLLIFLGFILVFFTGAFSGYFYFAEQSGDNIIIEEASQDCRDLFNTEVVNDCNSGNNSDINSQAQIKGEQNNSDSIILQNKTGMFVASKNSKIYHLPDCNYAKKIKEENKIYFKSAEEAREKGFSPHSCAEN